VTKRADDEDEHDRSRKQLQTGGRELDAEHSEEALQRHRDADAGDQSEQRTHDADHDGFDQHGAGHLSSLRADGAQQRVLPLTLRGSDREHVVDHEAGDAHRDEREHRQEDAEEAQRVLDRVLVLLGDLGTRQRFRGRRSRKRGLDPIGQHVVGHAAVAAHHDGVDEAGLTHELLRRGQIEQRERGAARRGRVAVAGDADQREVARPALGDDFHAVADLVVTLVGGRRVERDFRVVGG
jgi:hypothetical protein